MSLREVLASGRFAVTAQIDPAKGVDAAEFVTAADQLRDRVHAVNVSEQESAVMRLGSLAGCCLLKQKGVDPVLHMTCRDRNRIAIQSDLLNASVLGIENVLCLTGDNLELGDHRQQARAVFDIENSVALLQAAKTLQSGKDLAGRDLKGVPRFFLGSCVAPGARNIDAELAKMSEKAKAGAQFFQTRPVYDARKFSLFMKEAGKFGVPVLAGIMLIKSAAMARFMGRNIADLAVPEPLIVEMERADNKALRSIEIAARLINELKGICQGVHIMAMGWEAKIPAVLDMAKI